MADPAVNTAARYVPAASASVYPLPRPPACNPMDLEQTRFVDPLDCLYYQPRQMLFSLAQQKVIPDEPFQSLPTDDDELEPLNHREARQVYLVLQGALGDDLCFHVPALTIPRAKPPSIGFIAKEAARHGLLKPHIRVGQGKEKKADGGYQPTKDQPPMELQETLEYVLLLTNREILIWTEDLSEKGLAESEKHILSRCAHINAVIGHTALYERVRYPLSKYEQTTDTMYRRAVEVQYPELASLGYLPLCHIMNMLDSHGFSDGCPCENCSYSTLPFVRLSRFHTQQMRNMLAAYKILVFTDVRNLCLPVIHARGRLQLGARPLTPVHLALQQAPSRFVKLTAEAQKTYGPYDMRYEQLRFLVAAAVHRRNCQEAWLPWWALKSEKGK